MCVCRIADTGLVDETQIDWAQLAKDWSRSVPLSLRSHTQFSKLIDVLNSEQLGVVLTLCDVLQCQVPPVAARQVVVHEEACARVPDALLPRSV